LFRALPLDAPDEFAFLWSTNPQLGRVRAPFSYSDYAAFRDGLTSFDGLAAMTTTQLDLTGLDEPAPLEGFRVSANLFSTLGLSPLIACSVPVHDDRRLRPPHRLLQYRELVAGPFFRP